MLFSITPRFITELTPTHQGLLSGGLDSALSLPALLDKNKKQAGRRPTPRGKITYASGAIMSNVVGHVLSNQNRWDTTLIASSISLTSEVITRPLFTGAALSVSAIPFIAARECSYWLGITTSNYLTKQNTHPSISLVTQFTICCALANIPDTIIGQCTARELSIKETINDIKIQPKHYIKLWRDSLPSRLKCAGLYPWLVMQFVYGSNKT